MGASVLQLSEMVATGVQRAVYLHPLDPTKLIKVLRPAGSMSHRTNFNGIMDRLPTRHKTAPDS